MRTEQQGKTEFGNLLLIPRKKFGDLINEKQRCINSRVISCINLNLKK